MREGKVEGARGREAGNDVRTAFVYKSQWKQIKMQYIKFLLKKHF